MNQVRFLKQNKGEMLKTQVMNKKERIQEIDFCKGILIILMVMFHLPFNADFRTTTEFVYSFHMPAFLFISGILTNLSRPINLFIEKLKYLIRVYFIFETAYIIGIAKLGSFFNSSNQIDLTFNSWLYYIFIQPFGTYWFLHTLIMCLLFSYMFAKLSQCRVCTILISSSLTFLFCDMMGIATWQNAAFFFTGLYISDNIDKQKLFRSISRPSIFSILAIFLLFLNGNYIESNWVIVGLTLLFLSSACNTIPIIIRASILHIGSNSISVVLFSPFFTILVKKLYNNSYPLSLSIAIWIFSAIMVILLSLCTSKLLDKLMINKLISGRNLYIPFHPLLISHKEAPTIHH